MRGASALLNKDIRPAKMSTPHSGKPLVADMSSSSLSVTLHPAFSGDAAFRYWLEDHEALRSPFPAYMRELLQEHTFCHFMGILSKSARSGCRLHGDTRPLGHPFR